jgi:hypothetical protein
MPRVVRICTASWQHAVGAAAVGDDVEITE